MTPYPRDREVVAAIYDAIQAAYEQHPAPNSRDLLYIAGRAVGIGTFHEDIDDRLAQDLYDWEMEVDPDLHMLAAHLHDLLL